MIQAYSNHLKLRYPNHELPFLDFWEFDTQSWIFSENAALAGTLIMRCSSRDCIWKCRAGFTTNSGSRFRLGGGRTSWLISRLRMISTCMLNRRWSESSPTCWRRGWRTSTGASSQECCSKLLGDPPVKSRRLIPECVVTSILLNCLLLRHLYFEGVLITIYQWLKTWYARPHAHQSASFFFL